MIKIEVCIELEKIVGEFKKENLDLSEKLEYFFCDNQELFQRVESFEGFNFNLEMYVDKLLYEDIEDNVVKVNDSWKERFFDVENELSRIRFEKVNIEY